MKLAFLVSIDFGSSVSFRQRIEELCNEFSAKLIYSVRSNGPLRIVPAENLIDPRTHMGPARSPDREVNDAQGNERWGMDGDDHPCNRACGDSRGLVSDVPRRTYGLPERDGKQHPRGGPRDDHPALADRRNPPYVRVRLSPIQAGEVSVRTRAVGSVRGTFFSPLGERT